MDSNKRDYRIRYENDSQLEENTSEEQNIFINPDRNADWIKRAEAGDFKSLEEDFDEDNDKETEED